MANGMAGKSAIVTGAARGIGLAIGRGGWCRPARR